MAIAEYALKAYRNFNLVCEKDVSSSWSYRYSKTPPSEESLEEEIDSLRRRMSDLVNQGQSLTAENVVEASRELDVKINQYMSKRKRSR